MQGKAWAVYPLIRHPLNPLQDGRGMLVNLAVALHYCHTDTSIVCGCVWIAVLLPKPEGCSCAHSFAGLQVAGALGVVDGPVCHAQVTACKAHIHFYPRIRNVHDNLLRCNTYQPLNG